MTLMYYLFIYFVMDSFEIGLHFSCFCFAKLGLQVITDRQWKEVIVVFNFPTTITSASFVLRKYYLSLLYHFEQVYYFHKQIPSTSARGNWKHVSWFF